MGTSQVHPTKNIGGDTSIINISNISQILLLPESGKLFEKSVKTKEKSLKKTQKTQIFKNYFHCQQSKSWSISQSFDNLISNYDDFEGEEADQKNYERDIKDSFKKESFLIQTYKKRQENFKIPLKSEFSLSLFSLNKFNQNHENNINDSYILENRYENFEKNESLWFYDNNRKNLVEWEMFENREKSCLKFDNLTNVTCVEIHDHELILFAVSKENKEFNNNMSQQIFIFKFGKDNSMIQVNLKSDHATPINVLKMSKNAKILVSAAKDFSITIWESENNSISSFKKTKFLANDYKKLNSEFAPFVLTDKEIIYSLSSGKIKYEKSNLLIPRAHTADITCFLLTEDESKIVTGSQDCSIKIWNFGKINDYVVIKFKKPILALAFDKNETHLFSSSIENVIRIWNIERKHVVSQIEFQGKFAKKIMVSNSGNFLAIGTSENIIHCVSIKGLTNDAARYLNSKIAKCVLSPDGKYLFLGSKHQEAEENDENYNKNKEESSDLIRVLDITNDLTKRVPLSNLNKKGHNGDIVGIVATLDGKKLISASSDKTINLYSLETNELIYTYPTIHTKSITAITLIDNEFVMSGGEDNKLIKWDLTIFDKKNENQEKNPFKLFMENCHVDIVGTLTFCEKGRKLISGGGKLDNFIKIWDYEKQILIGEIEAHRQRINCILVSKNLKHLFTGSKDCVIKKWDLNTRSLIHKLEGHSDEIACLATTEMKVIVSGSADGDIRLWEVKNCMKIGILRGNLCPIVSIVIRRNQSSLFSISNDNIIREWSLENYDYFNENNKTGKISKNENFNHDNIQDKIENDDCFMLTTNNQPSVSAIHLTEDGNIIVVGYRDGSILLYDIETKQTFADTDKNDDFQNCKKNPIVFISSRNFKENSRKILQIFVIFSDNKIIRFQFDEKYSKWIDKQGELIINAPNSIYTLGFLDDDLFYGNGKDLCSINQSIKIDNKDCHSDYILSLSCSKQYLVTGSADGSFILWEKNNRNLKIEVLTQNKGKNEGWIVFVKLVQMAEKLLTAGSNGILKIWDMERMEIIKKFNIGVGLFIDWSYIDKAERLILLNNIIIDLQNDIFLFKNKKQMFNFNRFRTAFSRKHGKLFMINLENNDFCYGSLLFSHIFDYMREYSSFHFFFHKSKEEDISKTKNKIFLSIFKGEILFWPYFYNFLHLNALMNNTGDFEIKNLENFNNLPLSLFLQVDYKQRTCIDILLQKPRNEVNANLILIYFSLLFIAFDRPDTEFYQKNKFLNYDFRKVKKPENIFKLLKDLMNVFHEETSITCEILKRSYMDHPNLKLIQKEYQKSNKKLPILCTCDNKLFNSLNFEHKFKYKLEHFIYYIMIPISRIIRFIDILFYGLHVRTPNLKCKIICLPDLMHFSIKNVEHLFKHVCVMPLSNEIYSDKVLELLTRYKWNVELRSLFVKDMFYFTFFTILFHVNFVYLLPFKDDGIMPNLNIFVVDLILCAFLCYYLMIEIRQIVKFKFKKYVYSIFNWIDLLLIILVAIAVGSNFYQMLDYSNIEYQFFKLVYSVSSYFTWLRLISYYRGFQSTGFMIRLIINVLYDMRYFLLILFTFVLAFTYSGFLILGHWEYTVFEVFLMFYRVVLGDFNAYDTQYDDYYYSYALRIYLILGTILLTVTLLNLMVAIINATYSQVVASEEKTSNYELMNIIYDMESTIDINFCCRRNRKSRFQGKYLIHIYEEKKIKKVATADLTKINEMNKNIEKSLKILKEMTENKMRKDLRDRFKEIKEKQFFKNIVMRETRDIYEVVLQIIDKLNLSKASSAGDKVYLINALILCTESIKEAMIELFYLTSTNQRNFEEKSTDRVKLLLFELDELYKILFLNFWWTGEGQSKLFWIIENIKKNIESLDLSLGVYFPPESKNLKDLESIVSILKNDNKKEEYDRFRNILAGNFWIYCFGSEDHVPFKTFINKFKELVYNTERKSLNEDHINALRDYLQNEALKNGMTFIEMFGAIMRKGKIF